MRLKSRGGHNTADAKHNRAHAGHNRTQGEHNWPHAGHNKMDGLNQSKKRLIIKGQYLTYLIQLKNRRTCIRHVQRLVQHFIFSIKTAPLLHGAHHFPKELNIDATLQSFGHE